MDIMHVLISLCHTRIAETQCNQVCDQRTEISTYLFSCLEFMGSALVADVLLAVKSCARYSGMYALG